MLTPPQILIAEPNEHFQNSLEHVIEQNPHVQLAATAYDGRQLMQLADKHVPDIVITDTELPVASGIDAMKYIIKRKPDVGIIALSFNWCGQKIEEAIEAGATGIICKHSPCSDVTEAIKALLLNKKFQCRNVTEKLEAWLKMKVMQQHQESPEQLSDKEITILESLAEGMTHAQVARKANLSSRTIEDVKRKIQEKTGMENITKSMFKALKDGIIKWPV